MDIWKHSLLSQRKFGGKPEDYFEVHKFIDSSKLYFFHFKHRCLLHHTLGIEIATQIFGDYLVNQEGSTILIRDIVAEHCKEDLNNHVPTVSEWFSGNESIADYITEIPETGNEDLQKFILAPLLKSNCKASLIITCSDFGVALVEKIFDLPTALHLRSLLPQEQNVKQVLKNFQLRKRWQFTPNMEAIKMLEQ